MRNCLVLNRRATAIFKHDLAKSEFILLDGHLRVQALKDIGAHKVPRQLVNDDETYTVLNQYRIS